MCLVSFCRFTIYWSQVLSREWRCSWSSDDRRCSNYIWVINTLIVRWGATYIKKLTVYLRFRIPIPIRRRLYTATAPAEFIVNQQCDGNVIGVCKRHLYITIAWLLNNISHLAISLRFIDVPIIINIKFNGLLRRRYSTSFHLCQ